MKFDALSASIAAAEAGVGLGATPLTTQSAMPSGTEAEWHIRQRCLYFAASSGARGGDSSPYAVLTARVATRSIRTYARFAIRHAE